MVLLEVDNLPLFEDVKIEDLPLSEVALLETDEVDAVFLWEIRVVDEAPLTIDGRLGFDDGPEELLISNPGSAFHEYGCAIRVVAFPTLWGYERCADSAPRQVVTTGSTPLEYWSELSVTASAPPCEYESCENSASFQSMCEGPRSTVKTGGSLKDRAEGRSSSEVRVDALGNPDFARK